jgi:hypothetical protein
LIKWWSKEEESPMKRTFSIGFATLLLTCQGIVSMAVAGNATVIEGLTSTKDQGVVSVMSDPTLADGRLVLKVVAKNRAPAAASFGPQNVKVFTAAGAPVKLMSLEQLVTQTRTAAGDGSATFAQAPIGNAGPGMRHDSFGRPDVSTYTGGNDTMNGINLGQRVTASQVAKDDPKLQEQIASLNAAILQDMTIAPAAVAGGRIVTEKLKFARKEAHDLHVVVDFNGEHHEFDFAAPPTR